MKDKKILIGTALVLLLLLTTGLSYAYFSTAVKGNDNAKDVVVEAGTLKLTYTDGPAINAQNIKPGWSTTKEVSVKNNGTLDAYYNVIWQSLTNEITNDELVISATCQRLNASGTTEGTCESISQSPVNGLLIARKISIEAGFTHKYIFTILFKETNTDQNYNQGKEFDGVLGIEEFMNYFERDSWSTIIANVKANRISQYIVGDTRTIDMGTYGTHTLRVANTSTPSECSTSGFSQTACGFVLEFVDIITEHNMNDTITNVGGWPASSMRTFVNNDIYNALPTDLKNGIIDTTVVSSHGKTSGGSNFTSTDKLYLLSTAEIWEQGTSNTIKYDKARDITRQLDYYKNEGVTTSSYSKAIKMYNSSASYWWLRAALSNGDGSFFYVDSNGGWIHVMANTSNGVSPAFRLG